MCVYDVVLFLSIFHRHVFFLLPVNLLFNLAVKYCYAEARLCSYILLTVFTLQRTPESIEKSVDRLQFDYSAEARKLKEREIRYEK